MWFSYCQTPHSLSGLWIFFVFIFIHFRLPTWAERIMNDESKIYEFFQRGYTVWTGTDPMKKLRSGFLLKEMLDHFSKKLNSTLADDRSLRMYLYFAHDITIADMSNSLGIYMVNHEFRIAWNYFGDNFFLFTATIASSLCMFIIRIISKSKRSIRSNSL